MTGQGGCQGNIFSACPWSLVDRIAYGVRGLVVNSGKILHCRGRLGWPSPIVLQTSPCLPRTNDVYVCLTEGAMC